MAVDALPNLPESGFVFNETIIRNAQIVRQEVGLLTNDSMIVAAMREYGLSFLASNDADFGRVRDITVF